MLTAESRKARSPAKPAKHVDSLDGVRGIAILMVLMIHLQVAHALPTDSLVMHRVAAVMWAGWSGVDLFFTLSGFLITGILLRTKDAVNRGRSFYMRRFLRILPLYYLAVLAAMFASKLFSGHVWLDRASPHGAIAWLSYLFYYQNWWMPLKQPNAELLGHFWSLGVEEHSIYCGRRVSGFLPGKTSSEFAFSPPLRPSCCGSIL